jgi:hypothetical protein
MKGVVSWKRKVYISGEQEWQVQPSLSVIGRVTCMEVKEAAYDRHIHHHSYTITLIWSLTSFMSVLMEARLNFWRSRLRGPVTIFIPNTHTQCSTATRPAAA